MAVTNAVAVAHGTGVLVGLEGVPSVGSAAGVLTGVSVTAISVLLAVAKTTAVGDATGIFVGVLVGVSIGFFVGGGFFVGVGVFVGRLPGGGRLVGLCRFVCIFGLLFVMAAWFLARWDCFLMASVDPVAVAGPTSSVLSLTARMKSPRSGLRACALESSTPDCKTIEKKTRASVVRRLVPRTIHNLPVDPSKQKAMRRILFVGVGHSRVPDVPYEILLVRVWPLDRVMLRYAAEKSVHGIDHCVSEERGPRKTGI